jgi:hypothetical protein
VDYTQLDTTTRLSMVRARIRDIENQYMALSLRVGAPDLNTPVNGQDQANLAQLETSLARLHDMETQLVASSSTGTTPAAS